MKLNAPICALLLLIGTIFSPVYAQTSGISALAPGMAKTAEALSVYVVTDQTATTPTVTAPTQTAYAPFGSLKLTSTCTGALVVGGPITITFTLTNTLPPSTPASSLALNAIGSYTDNTGAVAKPPVSGTLTVASTAAVNNAYTAISFSVIVPVTEFVPSPPVAGCQLHSFYSDKFAPGTWHWIEKV